MRKYQPKNSALIILNIALLILTAALTVLARIYLVSLRILMISLIGLFWTAAIAFGFIILPSYFRRTVIYVSNAEICLHTGLFFYRRECMKMSAVQYVTTIAFPLSRLSGFNFIFVRGLGGTMVLPFLKSADSEDITSLLHMKITER
mgnify:CR=1 FL=1